MLNTVAYTVACEGTKRYGASKNGLQPLSGGFQNAVYAYQKNNEKFILRISHSGRRTKDMLQAEVDWVNYLGSSGVSVSMPVPSLSGDLIESVDAEEEEYYVTSFRKAKGRLADVTNKEEWNPAFFQRWGQLIGKMHAATKRYTVNEGYRPQWSKEHPDLLNMRQEELAPVIALKYEKLLANLLEWKKNEDTFGLIHNDFHQGNFFVENGDITVFDFDDCAYYWFANDLAVSFYHAYWQSTSFNPDYNDFSIEFISSMLEGYSKETTLHKDILCQIPVLLKLREMFLYTLFTKKWDKENLEGWQEYALQNLKHNIEHDVPYSDLDFMKL